MDSNVLTIEGLAAGSAVEQKKNAIQVISNRAYKLK